MTGKKLTTGQVAEAFGVTTRTVRQWITDEKLTATRTLGGEYRFDAADIARKLKEGTR